MLKRLLTGMSMAVAVGFSPYAHAAQTVDFQDRHFTRSDTYQTAANNFDEQGLSFGGRQFYFIPAGNPLVVLPTGYASTFMETAQEPVIITLAGGGDFDLLSLDLGLGAFNRGDRQHPDDVLLVATKAGCALNCTSSVTLSVGSAFSRFEFTALPGFGAEAFRGLSQISIGRQTAGGPPAFPPTVDSGYLAFDNITFARNAVPEPAAWILLTLGFGAAGARLRRNRRDAQKTQWRTGCLPPHNSK
jgi:hypothetical protein